MQIGEFAKVCNTKITVLRHYDKRGLLIPDYVDNFTGYRYYSKEQIPVFIRITALKKAGFTLKEIKKILCSDQSNTFILSLFADKKAELLQKLKDLTEAETMIFMEEKTMHATFFENNNTLYAKSELGDANCQNELRKELEKEILENGYQRISNYITYGNQNSNRVYVSCEVIKLSDTIIPLNENVNIKFENDESVVGKWQTVGEYAVKEDFYGDILSADYKAKDIYFLPNGEQYWCYCWSKGKLICRFGDYSAVNNYYVEDYNGSRYMFVEFKSYQYRRGGKPTVLVLKQIDNEKYSAKDIAKKDNIDMPFSDDKAVLGKWTVKDFCRNTDDFSLSKTPKSALFFKSVEFKDNGEIISVYGDKIIGGKGMQTWTKGYVLEKYNNTACAYKIRVIDNKEYLFIEWKNGDYIYGGFEPNYYVFERAAD